jgi:hypothetical protein
MARLLAVLTDWIWTAQRTKRKTHENKKNDSGNINGSRSDKNENR